MFKSMTTNLMVENVEKSLDFYTGILKFEAVTSVPNKKGGIQFMILVKDGLTLMLQERENMIEEYPALAHDKVQPSSSLYISIDNFEEFYDKIKQNTPLYKDIYTTFYGTKEFALLDNDGYILTFAKNQNHE